LPVLVPFIAPAMSDLSEAMKVIDGTVNTQNLILEKLKDIFGTNNIQGVINENS
jgi:hypothetical protein